MKAMRYESFSFLHVVRYRVPECIRVIMMITATRNHGHVVTDEQRITDNFNKLRACLTETLKYRM